MNDKTRLELERKVVDRGYERRNQIGIKKKVVHRGYERQNQIGIRKKSRSSRL